MNAQSAKELFDEAKTRLRSRDPEYLRTYVESVTQRSREKDKYRCPLPNCGSGTGKNGTGAFSINNKDHERWKCFSCGHGGDLFALIGEVENIPTPYDQLKRAGEFFGLDLTGREPSPRGTKPAQPAPKEAGKVMNTQAEAVQKEDFTAYFAECHKRQQETKAYLSERGILSEKLIKRFNLGYDPNFKRGTGKNAWKALVIPTSSSTYVVRNTDSNVTNKSQRYRNAGGGVTPFNVEALKTAQKPIFIVEGEIDALSIMEVGGVAIGIGGTSEVGKFWREYVARYKPQQPLILALDNDGAGKPATEELARALEGLGVAWYKLDPYMDCKDANEALLKDREAFRKQIARADHIEDEADREAHMKTSALANLQAFIDGIAESAKNPPQKTGFSKLDTALDGGLYAGLYTLGGITGLGKTTIVMQIADQIAEQGRDVLIFSLEMAREELMSKSISRHTLLDVMTNKGDIRNAKTGRGIASGIRYTGYSQTEKDLINRAMKAYGEYAGHLYIQEGIGDIGVDEIRKAVRQHIIFTDNKPVVIVDYVQILAPVDVRATDKANMDKTILGLKKISRDFEVPVIAVSALNRDSYKEGQVKMEAFKESGAIEYGSDMLLGLQYTSGADKTSGQQKDVELVILKNRNGKLGKVGFTFYTLFNYFKEV